MSITIQPLSEDTLPAVIELVLEAWHREWGPEFAERMLRWRFLLRQNGDTVLVMDEGRCVAMIDSFVRDYLIDGDVVKVRELCDWFSRPDYRGVGLKPARIMMKKPEPIISIGGSNATQALLPRLGFKPLPQPAIDYTLPLTGAALVDGLFKRYRIPGRRTGMRLAKHFTHPHRWGDSRHKSAVDGIARISRNGTQLSSTTPPGDQYQLASLINAEDIAWLLAAPEELGQFKVLEFLVDNQVIGVTLNRLNGQNEPVEGTIVHLQSAQVSVEIYRWMIDESISMLAASGASSVKCRTSCPTLADALQSSHFIRRKALQTLWWSPDLKAPSGPSLLSRFRADDALHPYPY